MPLYDQTVTWGRSLAVQLARESERPPYIRTHHLAPWLVVATVCFGAFMGQLDASIVTLAFPALQHQLHVGLANVEWVSLAYLITLVTLLAPVGKISDKYGRKLIYLYGFTIFIAASAACGFTTTLTALILFRVLQATGAAMLQANSVALVATSVPAKSRRAALGIQAAAQSLGLALGPVLGGVLIATVGWRWIFFINVPVGIIALIAGRFLLPRTHKRSPETGSDLPGLLLLAISVVSTLVLVSKISGNGLPFVEIIVLALVSCVTIAGLVLRENHTRSPLIDFNMLKTSGVARMLAGALFAYMVLFGPLVLFPQILTAKSDNVLKIGLLLSALPAGFGVAAIGAEHILPRNWQNRSRTMLGGLLACVSSGLLAVPAPESVYVLLLGILGLGLGIYIPANNTGIMASVAEHRAALMGGMVNIARGLGTAFGVAAVALALHMTMHRGDQAGLSAAMAAFMLTALLATWFGSLRGPNSTKPV